MTCGLRAAIEVLLGSSHLDVEFDTGPGTLALIGPNGAGKTTLLRALLGLVDVRRGHVSVGQHLLFDKGLRVNVPTEQRGLAYVPQTYALFPHMSARENVEFAIRSRFPEWDHVRREGKARSVLYDFGAESLAERRPAQLSGGERQRVALARAMAAEPRALLLDEPLSALDVVARQKVRAYLRSILARIGTPTVIVTHDPLDVQTLAAKVMVIERGKLVQTGTWHELVTRPASAFVEEFVETYYDLVSSSVCVSSSGVHPIGGPNTPSGSSKRTTKSSC